MNTIMKKVILVIFIFLFSASASFAFEGSGGYAGAFLRIPVGARPAGLGNAFVSVADDANALFYNPGGIYQLKGKTFAAMYSLMSMDRNHYQGSFIWTDDKLGAVGLMFIGYSVGKIDGRDSNGNPTGEFGDNEMAFSLTYGRRLLPFLGIGGSVKYLNHSLANHKVTGLGYDVGAHIKIEMKDSAIDLIRFGVSISNLGAAFQWDTESQLEEEIPSTLRYGASLRFNLSKINLLIAGGGTETVDELSKYNVGVEAWVHEILGIRAGIDGEDINFGASLRFKQFQFDYAFCPDVLGEGATSKLALQAKF